jgi:two-component system sensor histidine kinase YesM
MKGSFGKLLIESYLQNDDVIVKITDDGIGMDEEKLRRILEYTQESKESFGLTSVDERIKLYFGEEYGLKIESAKGEWTVVTIRIPKRKEDRHGNV